MTGSQPITAHLALHPADCLGLVSAPAEQSALGPLEGDVLRVEEGLDEGRGEAVLYLATITSDIRHPSITELTWSPELNFSEPRSGSEAISSVYTYNAIVRGDMFVLLF